MADPLQEMRELWKAFDLNHSENAGMRITYDNGYEKTYGTMPETDALRAFTPAVCAGTKPCCDKHGNPVRGKSGAR